MKSIVQKKMYGIIMIMILICCLLFASIAFLFDSDTLAWLKLYEDTRATDMQVGIDGYKIDISYSYKKNDDADYSELSDFSDLFSGLMPGDVVALKITYTNNDSVSRTVTSVLEAPVGCEVPVEIDGRYYYFSTQIRVVETGSFLIAPPDDKVSSDAVLTAESIDIGTLTLASGGTDELVMKFEFVDYDDVDQNAYQGFGGADSVGVCYRVVASSVK